MKQPIQIWQAGLLLANLACAPLEPSGTSPTPLPEPPRSDTELTNEPYSLELSIESHDSTKAYFSSHLAPIVARSCWPSQCHNRAEIIDLQSFPFRAEGSYTLDDIMKEIDPTEQPRLTQKRIVESLIDSMKTGYMPPAWSDASIPSNEDIQGFERWLEAPHFAEQPPFAAKITLTGMSQSQDICRYEWVLNNSPMQENFECEGAEEFVIALIPENGTRLRQEIPASRRDLRVEFEIAR